MADYYSGGDSRKSLGEQGGSSPPPSANIGEMPEMNTQRRQKSLGTQKRQGEPFEGHHGQAAAKMLNAPQTNT